MNTGIISSRYAKALLKLVNETGNGEAVYSQVRSILASPDTMPAVLEPELQRFTELLVRKNRVEYVKFIFHSFIDQYNESRHIVPAHLKTAVLAPSLERKLKELLESRLGGTVVISSEVDPSIIGGFVLTIDDKLLDASVSTQLEQIRRQFMDKNKRIV